MTTFQIIMLALFIPTIWFYSVSSNTLMLKMQEKPAYFGGGFSQKFIIASGFISFAFYIIIFCAIMINPKKHFKALTKHEQIVYPTKEYKVVEKTLYELVPIQN